MITLYGFGPAFGVPDPSYFVLKVDAYLRMAGIEYQSEPNVANMQKAPKGKLPYIDFDGELIADSQCILNELDRRFNQPLDSWLSEEQQGWSLLGTKSLDENLYWCIVHSRWVEEASWLKTKAKFFDALPPVVRTIVPIIARRNVRKNLHGHGMGRHSHEEIQSICQQSLQALSSALGEKPYFMGTKPCNFDAAAFAALGHMAFTTERNSMMDCVLRHQNLVDYARRIAEQYYPGEFPALEQS